MFGLSIKQSALASRLNKWFRMKNTGSAKDVTGSRAVHRRNLSGKYNLQTRYLGNKLESMVTPNAHLGKTTVTSG